MEWYVDWVMATHETEQFIQALKWTDTKDNTDGEKVQLFFNKIARLCRKHQTQFNK